MNRISNYDELVIERKKLESKIVQQRETLKNGLNDLEEKIGPFLNLLPILNIFNKKNPNDSMLKFIISRGVDLMASQTVSPNLNWLAKLILNLLSKKTPGEGIKKITV